MEQMGSLGRQILRERFSISCSHAPRASAPGGLGADCPLNPAAAGADAARLLGGVSVQAGIPSWRAIPPKLPRISGLRAHLLNFQVPQAIVSAFSVYIPRCLNLCLVKMQVGKLIHSFMSR